MVFSYMKTKLTLFSASRSFCSNRISASNNIPSLLQKITCGGFKAQAQSPLISRTSLNRFHLVSAVSLFGATRVHPHGFIVGTRRFYHSNSNSQTQRMLFRAFLRVSERAKSSLARTFLWASSRKWTASEAAVTVLFGSCLFALIFCGKIERIPYSKRFHYSLSDKLEKKVSEYQWKKFEEENMERILSQSDPRAIRIVSIARKILQAMNKGLMLQHQSKNIAQITSESSRLLNDKAQNFGASSCQEMIQQSQNRTRKLIWKPATKHLDGKVWEVYVTDSYLDNGQCLLDGKIVINTGLLQCLKSDVELATVIAHEIGHAVARHIAEGLIRAFLLSSQHPGSVASYYWWFERWSWIKEFYATNKFILFSEVFMSS